MLMIHIAFNIDDNYIHQCKVVMNSILANTNSEVHFHVIGAHIKGKNITCYPKPDISDLKYTNSMGHISMAATYRLYLADILTVDRVIYLDCDLIVLNDLSQLWEKEVKLIAGVQDPLFEYQARKNNLKHIYINSGVMLLNLAQMRKIDYKKRIADTQNGQYNLSLLDQDIINIAFSEDIELLDVKWNVYSKMYDQTTKEMLKARDNPSIIHWCGYKKPWNDNVWNKVKWDKYKNTMKKAIVLTYAPVSNADKKLLQNTDVFKIACNYYQAELNPNIRLCADNIVDKCLECDTCPVVSMNYDLDKERVINGSNLPNRYTTLVSCCDYLILNGYTHILVVATNPKSATTQSNIKGINSLKDCAYIYKYSDECNLDVETISIKEFLKMSIEENLILGIKEQPIEQKLLETLAFSDAYRYEVHTVGKDNKSIESGTLIANILTREAKQDILQGKEVVICNNIEIKRITGIKKEVKEEPEMNYAEMKDFVKANNIQVENMKKETLIQAIKEFRNNG